MLRRRTRPTKNKEDTKSEAATATPLTINVVDGGPAPPSAALCSILSHALQSSLKSTSNVCIAGERVLDDPKDLTDATTAQIGLYAHRGQDKSKAC
jgi:hypothetical protein